MAQSDDRIGESAVNDQYGVNAAVIGACRAVDQALEIFSIWVIDSATIRSQSIASRRASWLRATIDGAPDSLRFLLGNYAAPDGSDHRTRMASREPARR